MITYEASLDAILAEVLKHGSGINANDLERKVCDKITKEFLFDELLADLARDKHVRCEASSPGENGFHVSMLGRGKDLILNKGGYSGLLKKETDSFFFLKKSFRYNKWVFWFTAVLVVLTVLILMIEVFK